GRDLDAIELGELELGQLALVLGQRLGELPDHGAKLAVLGRQRRRGRACALDRAFDPTLECRQAALNLRDLACHVLTPCLLTHGLLAWRFLACRFGVYATAV